MNRIKLESEAEGDNNDNDNDNDNNNNSMGSSSHIRSPLQIRELHRPHYHSEYSITIPRLFQPSFPMDDKANYSKNQLDTLSSGKSSPPHPEVKGHTQVCQPVKHENQQRGIPGAGLPSSGSSIDRPDTKKTPLRTTSRERITKASASSDRARSRMRLMVLVKIIMRCLECEEPSLKVKAKRIIGECTQKNREGHPEYSSLTDVISERLRVTVGEVHWGRAENLVNHYMSTRLSGRNTLQESSKHAAI
mmetsp:Transcript_30081/g.61417  ORF Transcript_30081/g.61417 Transcript_30081/m.61417 type:complete len:248 (-) Transcript_30081:68-811(-)